MQPRIAKFIAAFVVAILLYALGLVVGPRVAQDQLRAPSPTGGPPNCLTSIDLPGPFGLLLNCDSPAFMEAASNPSTLAEPGNWRQNRPGQIWLAWAIAQPTRLFTSAMVDFANRGDVGLPQGATRSRAQAIADLGPGFVAYFIINVGLLAASLWLLRSSSALCGHNTLVASLVGAALLFNDITKAYLLSPHSQLMNILLPMVMVTLLFRWFRGFEFTTRHWLLLGGLCGLGLLAYATWVLVPFVLVSAVGWSWLRGGNERRRAHGALLHLPAVVALLAIPYLLWYGYVVHTAGSFYVHETAYDGGLVWLWQKKWPVVLWQLIGNLGYLVGAAFGQSLPYAAFLAAPVVVLAVVGCKLDRRERSDLLHAAAAAALVTTLFLCFFALLGFRMWRYAVPMLPAWTLPIALLNSFALARVRSAGRRRLYVVSLVVTAAAVAVFQVAKDGPWG